LLKLAVGLLLVALVTFALTYPSWLILNASNPTREFFQIYVAYALTVCALGVVACIVLVRQALDT